MTGYFAHVNINVTNREKSIAFYQEALGLHVQRQKEAEDGSFILTFLTDAKESFALELTWLRDHPQPYDLGENEGHIAFYAEDMDAAYQAHKAMGCVVYENPDMGIYFIVDPDGYWLEIVPQE